MKISTIALQNMLSIQAANLSLPGKLTLVAGSNRVGKSALLDSVRFVLGAGPRGITAKSRVKHCIRRGAESGRVVATINGTVYRRDLKTGEFDGDRPVQLLDNPAWPIALAPERVLDMGPDKLLELLLAVSPHKLSAEEVSERLRALPDVIESHVEDLEPFLNGSLELVERKAKEGASLMRKDWEEITGERFGSKKAADWGGVDLDDGTRVQLANSLADIEEKMEHVRIEAGHQGLSGTCPHCEGKLSWNGQKFVDTGKFKTNPLKAAEELKKLEAKAAELKKELGGDPGAALETYRKWLSYDTIAKELSPSGLPSTLAKQAMEPIRAFLAAWAKPLGVSVEIDDAANVSVDGIPHELLSVSEKWRAYTLLGAAIVVAAGLPVILIYQWDWLAPQDRGAWFKFFSALDIENVFVAGVLKAASIKSNDTLNSFWAEGGTIQAVQ